MSKAFTVIGYWRGDRPVSVGVIEGERPVHAGEGATEEGDWSTSVHADSPEDAETLAVAEMRLSEVGAEDGEDEPGTEDDYQYQDDYEGDGL